MVRNYGVTTTSNMPPPVQKAFSELLLSTPQAYYIHSIPVQKRYMPRNAGTTMVMRRNEPLDSALVPLGNSGVDPAAQIPVNTDVEAKISFYGTWIMINEQVTLQSQDPVLNAKTLLLGQALKQTEDDLIRNMLVSTASAMNATNGGGVDVPTRISLQDIRIATRALMQADARTTLKMVEASDLVGTSPIRDAYFGLAHSDVAADLESEPTFVHKSAYGTSGRDLEAEWGHINNVRVLLSSRGSKVENSSALGNDVYNVIIMGMEAVGCIKQDGYSARLIYRPGIFNSPLAQNASLAFTAAQAPVILNDAWVLRMRVTVS